jgi:GNAT superfamily N-acetyltransferase
MTYEEREQVWSRILRGEGEPSFTLVAEIDGQIVGFAGGGPDRNDNPIFDAELFASYVRPSHQRQGIGRELVSAIAQRFIDGGMESMLVQTLAENDDAEFYMTLGAAHL